MGADIDTEDIFINADRLHLRRLFFNLIDNAIKFTDRNGKISISLCRKNNEAIISVSDTGIGIEEEDLLKVFDKFFRIDRKDGRSEPGTGLGLSIVQSIARVHKANVAVKSEPGKGSVFTVILPVS